jgi:hypothetical protein
MGIITKMRKQKAVYWPPSTYDAYGQPTMGTAVQIDCRWEDKSEQFLDANGQEQLSNAIVYVSQDVALGGMLWLGLLASAPVNPKADDDAWEIRKFEKLPNLKASEFLRTVML